MSTSVAPNPCTCPCHQGVELLHPVPCCGVCRACGLVVANGVAHACPPGAAEARAARLERMRSRRSGKDQVLPIVIIVMVMGLAVYSVPWPGSAVFCVAIVGGVALALLLHRSRRMSDPTIGERGHSRED